jgi:rubrerythrin
MKKDASLAKASFEALMYQLLETELGGIKVYTAAINAALNDDLKEEWKGYLEDTRRHVQVARELLEQLGLDPDAEVPARLPVRTIGAALLEAMAMVRKTGSAEEAQLIAAECVVEAETKDHMNWELVGALAEKSKGDVKKLLKAAFDEVEKDEDHHLYHTTGWARELWLESLGLPAVLPPPEEVKKVETAIGAARAKNAREEMI